MSIDKPHVFIPPKPRPQACPKCGNRTGNAVMSDPNKTLGWFLDCGKCRYEADFDERGVVRPVTSGP